jgi:predicted permease
MRFRLLEWWRRWRETFRHRDGSETEEELRFHLEMAERDALRRGQTVRGARLRAGGVAQGAEEVRDQGTIRWLSDFLRDSRHGIRLLARSPVFTAAAIVSLALGIGANTAIFSLMDAVMLRMMPVHEPERLVQFAGGRELSYPLFRQFGQELHCFTDMFAQASLGRRDVIFDDEPEAVTAELVSGNYYSVLRVSAFAGRTFDAEIDRNPTPVAIISHAYWMRRFGLNPAAIGRAFRHNGRVFTIVGVTPPEFHGVEAGTLPEITLPLSMAGEIRGDPAWLTSDAMFWLSAMGRLCAGYTIERAQAEVDTVYSRVLQAQAEHERNEFRRKKILDQRTPLEASGNGFDSLRSRFGEPLRLLMGIVALILLIACANLANLLLGRATTRRREIAVRLAMGAGRGRVLRQMLAEGMLLAAAAGVLGVLLAWGSANALVVMMSNGGERIALNLRPNPRILAFAASISAGACLLFSLAPAIQATRQGIQPALAEARLGARWRWGRGLIAAQVAISVLLVIAAGLFGRTLLRLYSIETGFHREDVILISVKTDRASLQGHALRGRILESLRSMPGVASASFEMSPLNYKGYEIGASVEGYTYGPNEDQHVHVSTVAEDYFRTLRTPVILGREFNDRDTPASPKAVVVNEAFARRYFHGLSPLGKRVTFKGEPRGMEIVGMAKDIRRRDLKGDVPAIVYANVAQANRPPTGVYIVRGAGIAPLVDPALKRVDGKLLATDVRTLDENLSRSILRERMLGTLSGLFGALSLILVSVGVYGVMAFQVARRQKEIGIRMALGARPVQVTGMVLAETAVPVGIGVGIGTLGAFALTRLAEKMLYGVTPTDPVTFAGASVILILLGLFAAYGPSRRAARLSPVETLRCE